PGEVGNHIFDNLVQGTDYYVYAVAVGPGGRTAQSFVPPTYRLFLAPPLKTDYEREGSPAPAHGGFRLFYGVDWGSAQSIPDAERHHIIVSKTDISSRLDNFNNVADAVAEFGLTDNEDVKVETIVGGSSAKARASFSGLTPGFNYYVYVVAVKEYAPYPVLQDFRARTGINVPAAPSYTLSSDHQSITFTQNGNVPAGEIYYLFVSKSPLSNLGSGEAVEDAAIEIGGTGSHKITNGARTYTFTSLDAETEYYVYAVAVNDGGLNSQDFGPDSPIRTTGVLISPNYSLRSIRSGLRFTHDPDDNVPAGETYYVVVSKTAIANISDRVGSNRVPGVGDDSDGKFAVIASGDPRSVQFTGLDEGEGYYVYAISVKGEDKAPQNFKPARAVAGLPPSAPDYRLSSISEAGLRFTQLGNVPAGETYYVIVSKSPISNASDRVGSNRVTGVGNDADGKFAVIASGRSRSVEFTGLTAGASYYVYAISVKGSLLKTPQVFSPSRYSAGSSAPSAPDYRLSSISGGLRFTQLGNVPAGETYYVIVSKTAIANILDRVGFDTVSGVGNDSSGKFAVISSGDPRSVEFSGLTPGVFYYIYAVSEKDELKAQQDPSRYAAGSSSSVDRSVYGSLSAGSLVVYPNPSPGVVYISGANPGDVIDVYSSSGVFLGSYELSLPGGSVDLSALDAGLYILELNGSRHRVIID
ncbi:MAG: T9SS type A sorting domain-containing protein, partial [Cytophagales bacterium]|nr:T9SS type A sorting domain-containing protein [Cytophagales bacterium]